MAKQRRQRLRKKLHVGEFQEFGFNLEVQVKEAISPAAEEILIDAFLGEVIEPLTLAFGGWVSGGYVCKGGRGSATEEDRAAIIDWLIARPEVASVRAGELSDVWHGHTSDATVL